MHGTQRAYRRNRVSLRWTNNPDGSPLVPESSSRYFLSSACFMKDGE